MSVKGKIVKAAFSVTPQKIKKWIVNKQIDGYGEMIEFRLDLKKRELYAKALLSGENEPIELHIQDYRLVENSLGTCIIVEQCVANRQWITALMGQFVSGKEFPIPRDKFNLIKELLSH